MASPSAVVAHGAHAAQPIAIIDPLITHHAVLEDELKLNLYGSRVAAEQLTAGTASVELAYAFTDLLGAELFLPLGASSTSGNLAAGLGDIELQIPKVSFLRRYGWVMTAYPAIVAPTGSDEAGLRGDGWVLAPHLLTDIALGSVGVQLNAALELSTGGEVSSELRTSVAYTVELRDELLASPLVELDCEVPIDGDEGGVLLVVLGGKFALGGWHLGAGVQLPVAGEEPFDFTALLQFGYHVTWIR